MESAIISIDSLPPELISHIFSFLDGPAPSDVRLRDQPSPSMLASPYAPLKAVSLVSKRWRAIALPVLFRHVLWAFDRWDLVFSETCGSVSDAGAVDGAGNPVNPSNPTNIPLLTFVRANGLERFVESLTLIVSDRMYGQYRLAEASTGGSRRPGRSALDDLDNEHLEDDMRDLLTNATARAGWTSRWRQRSARGEDSNWLWEMLFNAMDPKRFTIIALPRMLASLLSRMLFLGDAWSFRDQWHVLSLDRRAPGSLEKWRPARLHTSLVDRRADGDGEGSAGQAAMPAEQSASSTEPAASSSKQPAGTSDPAKPVKTVLFTIRPWKAVLLNEGSSTRVYKTYEFFLKRPPSILGSLLGCEEAPNDEPLIPPSVRSFSYVAIFPLSSHFNRLVNHLPRLDNLYLQLVPRNDILDNKEEMSHITAQDLWMERNTCYSLVMRALFGAGVGIGWEDDDDDDDDDEEGVEPTNGWAALKVFESGDAADKEAWDMAVEYVRLSGTSWRVVADGVLVKGAATPGGGSTAQSEHGDTNPGARDSDDDSGDEDEASHWAAQSHNEGGGFELLSVLFPFL